jgi:hypothetical protein
MQLRSMKDISSTFTSHMCEPRANGIQLIDFEIGNEHTLRTDNGYQLFPPNLNEGIPSFYVTQIGPNTKEPLRLLVTGYTFRYNGARTVSDEGTELLPMTLQIASLDGVAVSPPVLTINVLKDTSGRLMIASVGTTQTTEASPLAQDKDCNEWPLLCKWKIIVAERIEKMKKGCHKASFHNPMKEDSMKGKPPHRFRPGHPHRPHHKPHHMGHGHGHHSHGHMHVFARRAFFTIFIPIVVGIFAGTVTYLIGMVLGTLIAILLAKIRGQDYQRIALDEEDVEEGQTENEVQAESEKNQEYVELPAYDAPPVYEEAVEKEIDE